MNRKALVVGLISLAVLVAGVVVLFAMPVETSSSIVTTETEIITSSESDFPFWIFIAILPAIFIPIMVASKQENAGKAKNDDQLFDDKPKNDRTYTVGSDGELIELSEVETLFDQR